MTASTKIAKEPIRVFSQIDRAGVVVVLDETILDVVDVMGQARKGAVVVINTQLAPEAFCLNGCGDVATVDATGIAIDHHLIKEGAPVINTPLLGALAKATGLVSLDNLGRALKAKLSKGAVSKNFAAVQSAYEMTNIKNNTAGA